MEVNLFNQNCFASPDTEEGLIVFKDHINSFPNLVEFGYACAFHEYQQEILFYGQLWAKGHTWDDRRKIFNPIQINQMQWTKAKNHCVGGLNDPTQVDLQGVFYDAYLMHDGWNLKFVIAQIDNFYYALSWNTSA